MSSSTTRRMISVCVFLVAVVAIHLLTIWAAPRLIMQILMNGSRSQALNMRNNAAFSAPVTAASRDVVMPSPDMLYSMCVFDLSQGPVRVTANPQLKSYWSIALYAANSDNFFVINDKQAGDAQVDLWLSAADANSSTVPAGSKLVRSPSTQGFLLMRVLTGNYQTEKSVVEPARRTLRCAAG
ncbi:MAG: DUF1254 domain-containing protein [Rhodocyclaceae bacterium]|nr:DUF1254 domain-containing protein [Rhodocyclaceae bacterium]MBP6278170.1 DUF1254 domain-containing protein [Rhodocyclaceae bacterium]